MDGITTSVSQILSSIIIAGLLAAWLALIVRRYRAIGPMAPLQDREWFKDIFRQGLEIIKRSRWILIVPLAAAVVQFCQSAVQAFFYLKEHSRPFGKISPELTLYTFSDVLRDLRYLFTRDFFGALGQLNSAMLNAIHTSVAGLAFLLLISYSMLKSRPEHPDLSGRGFDPRIKRWMIAFLSLATFIYMAIAIWNISLDRTEFQAWALIPMTIAYLMFSAFAYSLFIQSMDAADRGQAVSIGVAFSKMTEFFQPLFLFLLLVMALGIVAYLPSYVYLTGNSGSFSVRGNLAHLLSLTGELQSTLLGMIAFVPVIIVVRRKTFSAAFNACAELWARNAKNAVAFVIISALLLLIPAALQIVIDYRFPGHRFNHYFGWANQTIRLISSLYKVTAGTLIMCSMVVFCRRVLELEEPTPPSAEEG